MSATEIENTGSPLPRMSEIQALPDFRLAIAWAEGSRRGRTDLLDLAPIIYTYKLYRPLRNNEELFQTARLVDGGNVVEWGDGRIDMSAELVEEIANETMTPQDFASFLERNGLTQEAAAALLGYSRRQIGNFVSVGPIPRVVALACYGYEVRTGTDEVRTGTHKESQPESSAHINEQVAKETRAMLLQTAQHFSEQLKEMRSEMRRIGTHKEHQPETSPNTYEQVAKETRAMLLQTAQNFSEQLKEMRSEMRREIEATRAELRQNIFELPQETAESAAQMRRVLVDQIEALSELNRIVARHGRNLDVAEPRIEPRIADPRISETRIAEPWIAEPRMEPAEPPPRREVVDEAPVPPPQRPARAAKPVRWLSDLLTRASSRDSDTAAREPTGREPPPAVVESLGSIALDITRMIDHEAAAELWDRYKRGERNIFTRKLYTMQGQRTFDDIRRRYRSDPKFMQTVDQYMAEFERLLDDVSRDDREQMVARTYLTSETGKVYTMLAKAAGRFDQ
jgi:preprotein translocase subunit SecE